MKYSAMIITVAISLIFLTSLAYAEVPANVNIYAWTDKANYDSGERGVLYMVVRNDRKDENLTLENITITYPWFAYTGEKWEGNDTIKPDAALLKDGGVYVKSVEFEVPNDGRAIYGVYGSTSQINVKFAVDKAPYWYTHSTPIYIKSAPLYMAFEDMDKLITLLTVQVVLLIVCTIIIAATISLSARRPQVTWKKEEKVAE